MRATAPRGSSKRTLLYAAAILALIAPSVGMAVDPNYPAKLKLPELSEPERATGDDTRHEPVLSWETGKGKSYLVPALEIPSFQLLLSVYDRHFQADPAYDSTWSSIKQNASRKWVVDNDPFSINQFGHPYQGSIYYGFARSAGLNYWESLGYTFVGSAVWEIAGETTPPSKNDQIATGIGGTFLGEPLFRMSSLLLEGADGTPSVWRELGAALISPSTGFNRLAFGERFDTVFPSHHPAYYSQLQIGASYAAHLSDQGGSQPVEHGVGNLTFSLAYGLPGKADYSYSRPFDYFDFEATAATANVFESIFSRGLLVGSEYALGDAYRGIWGLYGSYDYVSPQAFRVSSTALSLGTTAQWWLSKTVALQGTTLGGLGYGAAGTIHGQGERDYHYGLTPQALIALKMIFGERAALDLVGREYFVSRVASTENRGSENILRGEASATVRIWRRHALTLKYVVSHREASYPDLGDRSQTLGTVWLFYTLLGDTHFGATEWRSTTAGP